MSRTKDALKTANETCALRIGSEVLDEIAVMFKEQFPGKRAVVVADKTTRDVASKKVEEELKKAGVRLRPAFIFTQPDLYAEYSYIDLLVESLKEHDAISVAVGSGTINDLTRLSPHLTGRGYMCVATVASMDGYTALGASITAGGAKQTFSCPTPLAILADTDIIRKTPGVMAASGYADLFAKVTAGTDWILADWMGVEKIGETAWSIIQDGLHDVLANPEGTAADDDEAISQLIEGLMLGGFAMQWSKSSRSASGAEHQFSHLWNMEHHLNSGEHISHGFQVSIGMLTVTAFYEQVLRTPLENLDVEACCAAWPTPEELEKTALEVFVGTDSSNVGVQETKVKYVTREELAVQLQQLEEYWSKIRERLLAQLLPYREVKQRLELVGVPTEPEQTGITRKRLRDTFTRAQFIRRRFTMLDPVVRSDYMKRWLDGLSGKGKIWEIAE